MQRESSVTNTNRNRGTMAPRSTDPDTLGRNPTLPGTTQSPSSGTSPSTRDRNPVGTGNYGSGSNNPRGGSTVDTDSTQNSRTTTNTTTPSSSTAGTETIDFDQRLRAIEARIDQLGQQVDVKTGPERAQLKNTLNQLEKKSDRLSARVSRLDRTDPDRRADLTTSIETELTELETAVENATD
jgi:chromosome segregation ATPase